MSEPQKTVRRASTQPGGQPAAKKGQVSDELSNTEKNVVQAIALKWNDKIAEFSVSVDVDGIAKKIAVVKGNYAAVFTLDGKTCYRVMRVIDGIDTASGENSMLRQQKNISDAIKVDFIFPGPMSAPFMDPEIITADGQPFYYQYQTMAYGGNDCVTWLENLGEKKNPAETQKFVCSLILFLSRFVNKCLNEEEPFSVFSSDIKLDNIVCNQDEASKAYQFKHIDLDSWSVYYHAKGEADITHAVTTFAPVEFSYHSKVIKDIANGNNQEYNLAVLQYEMVSCCLLTVLSVFGIRYIPFDNSTAKDELPVVEDPKHVGMPRASFIASYIGEAKVRGRKIWCVKKTKYDITFLVDDWNQHLEKIKTYLRPYPERLSYFASFTDLCSN